MYIYIYICIWLCVYMGGGARRDSCRWPTGACAKGAGASPQSHKLLFLCFVQRTCQPFASHTNRASPQEA